VTGTGRRRRIARNTVFNSLSSLIGAGAGFVTSIVIARGLGPTGSGVYTLVIWTAIGATSIVSAGLTFAIIKFVAQYDLRTQRETLVAVVGFGLRAQALLALAGGAALALGSGLLAEAFNIPDAQSLFALASLVVVLGALTQASAAPIAGLERQALLVPLGALNVLGLLGGAIVVLLVWDAAIRALIVCQIVVGFVVLAVHLGVLSRLVEIRIGGKIPTPLKRRIASYAASMTVMSTLGLVVWQRFEVFILGYFRPSSDVAFYSIAYAMAEALQQMLPAALSAALFPSLSRAFALRDHEYAGRAYQSALRYTTMMITPVAVTGALLGGPAIHILYGDQFAAAALPLAILLFSAGVQRLTYSSIAILLASDHDRLMVWFTAAFAVVNAGLAVALIPSFGVVGATIAATVTQFVAGSVAHQLVRRTVGFGFPTAAVVRVVAANIPVFGAVGLVVGLVSGDLATLIAGMAAVAPSYAFGLCVTRALEPIEREALSKRFRSVLPVTRNRR
jgi:O-antigen/teichoic acid export membrane protein